MQMPPTILEAGRQFRRQQASPREIVEICLQRIDAYEKQLQAWVLVDREGALQEASRREAELRDGRDRGPLHGIPLGVKDIIDVAGMATRAGSALTDEATKAADAPLVARLREAGAIVLGKTVTTELACFDPPPTRNPWNLLRTPGGSSSGSACAVAAGMCLGALGSQTGGSITRPASYCGVAGLKPTHGRLDVTGIVPVSRHLDHPGPIARCVADLEIVFAVLADRPPEPASEAFRARQPHMGVLAGYFLEQASAEVAWVFRSAIDALVAAGAKSSLAALPAAFGNVHQQHWRLMAREAALAHGERYRAGAERLGPKVAGLIREGLADAQRPQLALQAEFRREAVQTLGHFDALVTPATPTTAPDPSTTGDPKFNSPWSYAGLPTVSIPCGLAEDGLPVGLQLVGHLERESELLAVAAWCERHVPPVGPPPLDI